MFSREFFEESSPPSSSISRVIRNADRLSVDYQLIKKESEMYQSWQMMTGKSAIGTRFTNLEGELCEGVGETRKGLETGSGLRYHSQGACRACTLSVGDLHASGFGNVILKTRSSRGHCPTAGNSLQRTRRISTESRSRQHHRMWLRKELRR